MPELTALLLSGSGSGWWVVLVVLVLVRGECSRQTVVDLVVAGHAFRISGRSFALPRASFDELKLFDGLDAAVMSVPSAPVSAA